jgi:osmotically-inducible protein OsmY
MTNRDRALVTEIEQALRQDPRVDDQISVGSRAGIVILAGKASSRSGMLIAIQIAASFPGCRGVVNRQVLAA